MKVRIKYTVDVDEDFRRAVRSHYGISGMATRQEIRDWFENRDSSDNDDLMFEYHEGLRALERDET